MRSPIANPMKIFIAMSIVLVVVAVVTMVVVVGLIECGVVSSLDCGWRRSRASGPDIVSHTHTHILRITWRWRA